LNAAEKKREWLRKPRGGEKRKEQSTVSGKRIMIDGGGAISKMSAWPGRGKKDKRRNRKKSRNPSKTGGPQDLVFSPSRK